MSNVASEYLVGSTLQYFDFREFVLAMYSSQVHLLIMLLILLIATGVICKCFV